MDKGEIYCLTSPSGKKYIGQAVCFLSSKKPWGTFKRWDNHIIKAYQDTKKNMGRCRALDAAIRKYGPETFNVEKLITCSINKLNQYEIKYIKDFNTLSPNGYNLTTGGGNGFRWSETSRKFMSEKMKILGGHSQTEETKKKISKTLSKRYGKIIAKRNKQKVGISQKRKNGISLPVYIYQCKRKGVHIGYFISGHPKMNGKNKYFSSSKFTLEENLAKAKEHIKSLIPPPPTTSSESDSEESESSSSDSNSSDSSDSESDSDSE